jgi:hypothetical protein
MGKKAKNQAASEAGKYGNLVKKLKQSNPRKSNVRLAKLTHGQVASIVSLFRSLPGGNE